MKRWTKEERALTANQRYARSKKGRDTINFNARKRHYVGNYDITIEERNILFSAQDNKCACCGSLEPGNTWGFVVDHDHTSNVVRGIICQPCNVALGQVKDRPAHLRALIKYLDTHGIND
jgi:hypothetical protein